jgi:hypothetical protein
MQRIDTARYTKPFLLSTLLAAVVASFWSGFFDGKNENPNINSYIDSTTGLPETSYNIDGYNIKILDRFIAEGISAVAYGAIVSVEFDYPLAEPYSGPVIRNSYEFGAWTLETIMARIIPGQISENQFRKIQRQVRTWDRISINPGKHEISDINNNMKYTSFCLSSFEIFSTYKNGEEPVISPVGRYYIDRPPPGGPVGMLVHVWPWLQR